MLLAGLLAAHAQTSPDKPDDQKPKSTDDDSRKDQEAAVKLNPFVVSTDSDTSWTSSQAVSGTRTRTELANLPMSMQVYTDQLIKDLGVDNLIDVVTFAAGVTKNTGQDTFGEDNTNFTLRGQASFVPMRNGFRRLRLVTTENIERVEIIKGPASLLYGQLNPGGNVNYITKRPQLKGQFAEIRGKVGSYGYYGTSGDYNGVLVPDKLAFRLVAAYHEQSKEGLKTKNVETLVNPSVTWWITPGTTLTLEYENAKRNRNYQQSPLPYSNLVDIQHVPWAGVDRTFTSTAPSDYFDTLMEDYTAEFTTRINDNFTVRANHTEEVWSEKSLSNATFTGLSGPNLDMLSNRRGRYGERGSWDNWTQVELANEFKWGGVGVKNLFGWQREELEYRNIISTSTIAYPNTAWDMKDRSTWVVTAAKRDDFIVSPSSGSTSTNLTKSWYFSNQLAFLDGKLRTLAGMRVDKFKVTAYNSANGQTTVDSAAPAHVPEVGVLYKVTPHLSVYASYSESFLPLYSTSRREDGSYYSPKPQTGVGEDFGVKGSLLDGKLDYTAAIFQVDNTNIVRFLPPVTIGNEVFSPTNQSGKESSRGFEFDSRWQPTKQTQLIFSYGYTDAWVANDPQTTGTVNGQTVRIREGHDLAMTPKHTAAFFVKQDLGDAGGFNKVYVTVGGHYQSAEYVSDTYTVVNNTLVDPWKIDSRFVLDAGIGGQFALGRQTFGVSVNVKNVLDKDYLSDPYRYAPGREIFVELSTKF